MLNASKAAFGIRGKFGDYKKSVRAEADCGDGWCQ